MPPSVRLPLTAVPSLSPALAWLVPGVPSSMAAVPPVRSRLPVTLSVPMLPPGAQVPPPARLIVLPDPMLIVP